MAAAVRGGQFTVFQHKKEAEAAIAPAGMLSTGLDWTSVFIFILEKGRIFFESLFPFLPFFRDPGGVFFVPFPYPYLASFFKPAPGKCLVCKSHHKATSFHIEKSRGDCESNDGCEISNKSERPRPFIRSVISQEHPNRKQDYRQTEKSVEVADTPDGLSIHS